MLVDAHFLFERELFLAFLTESKKCVCVCFFLMEQEEHVAEAVGREEAADRRLQQLQTALSQLEARWTHTHYFPPFIKYSVHFACFARRLLNLIFPHCLS